MNLDHLNSEFYFTTHPCVQRATMICSKITNHPSQSVLQLSAYEEATGSFPGLSNPYPSAVCHSLVSVTLGQLFLTVCLISAI